MVRPTLLQLDAQVFRVAAKRSMPALGVIASELQAVPSKLPSDLMYLELGHWFRCWAIVRLSGFWPSTLFGCNDLLTSLPACPLCGAADVGVGHALFSCEALRFAFEELASAVSLPPRSLGATFSCILFQYHAPTDQRARFIKFVGQCMHMTLTKSFHLPGRDYLEDGELAGWDASKDDVAPLLDCE